MTAPESPETTLPRLSGSPEGSEGRGGALARFIHRPLPVRAILWDGTPEVLAQIQAWVASEGGEAYQSGDRLVIRHRSGSTPVRHGDWLARSGVWLTCPADAFDEHCTPDPLGDWPRWGSAADTVCEHPDEADVRSQVAQGLQASVVHRWPSGPWLTDDERVWVGDESLARLQVELFEALQALATARRDLAEAHEVIDRLMSQRPTAGTCGCPTGRFDAQGLCTNADCEHPVERHESGRCDVALTDAPGVWDASVAPGGLVCSVCRTPMESEPCREHQPAAWEAMT